MDKRQQLVETAFALFYAHGVAAVGINQILQASGIAKKTLYHHFSSKEELLAAVVAYRDERYYDWLASRLAAARNGIEVVEALFDALDDWFNDRVDALTDFRGCFFINVCGEYGDPEHPVHRQCQSHKLRVVQLIADRLQPLAIDDRQRLALSESICLLKEGATVQAHVQNDLGAAQRGKQLARQLLQSYL
ncbi:TetR/AcrR family transcriptional regulator [Marinobacterium arenosum]|uniref:TetR/AcrR family transcriptional regulator n=1 Tax=Marinobacterium arenosum TaxID=2862496 RepID=UPI001C9400AF|nr:TetR/AcrR family transcriptional regulator [Marinobacterium arenosum]MBY4675325.1 TetR/AcrR family transcriptional regulator [Marinobacterium arenosum]